MIFTGDESNCKLEISIMKKLLFAALALTTVAAASPALAAKSKTITHQRTAYEAQANEGYVAAPDRFTVVEDNQIVGRDPDAFIRLQLLRDAHMSDY
jgi:hypothetical protein